MRVEPTADCHSGNTESVEGIEDHTEDRVEGSSGGLRPVFYMCRNACREEPRGICVFSVGITEWQKDGVGGLWHGSPTIE